MIFNNTSIELYSYVDLDLYDDYGEKIGDYVHRETVECDVQPLSMQDSQAVFGKVVKDSYKAYLDKEVEVNDTDLVKIADDTYTIVGSPFVWNHLLPHKKIILQKDRVNRLENGL